MVELDNYKVELSSYEKPLAEVRDSLNLGEKQFRREGMEKNVGAPDFWEDAEKASQSMKEVKELKDIVSRADGLSGKYEDIMTLIEMAYEEEDEELAAEIKEELEEFVKDFDDLRITTMVNMTRAMPSLPCTREPGEPRAVTGRACCAGCIRDGQKKKDIL